MRAFLAEHIALAGGEIKHLHLGRLSPKGHERHLIATRRKARRDQQFIARGQRAEICAILIDDREALAALFLGAGFIDEDDAGIEKAGFAGDAFEHRIDGQMRKATPVAASTACLLADNLLCRWRHPRGDIRPTDARHRARHAR